MPQPAVQIDDREWRRAAERALRNITLRSERDLVMLAIKVQNEARRRAPVDTGRLRASIQHVPGRDARGPYVDVGTNVEYAPHVEYGTVHQSAQPYMRPALLAAADTWARMSRG